ncbi:MAG: transglutaminase-like domain-containing protein [Armatimonadota bacterium]
MKTINYLVLLIMLIINISKAIAFSVPYEAWMGTYMAEQKIGYMSFKISESDYKNKPGYKITTVLSTKMNLLGSEIHQLVTTVVYTDKEFMPVKEEFSMSSGGKTTKVHAVFNEDTIDCVVSAGSGLTKHTIDIPKGATFVGDLMFGITDETMEKGKEYTYQYFNPLTLSVDPLTIVIEREEKIQIGGKSYDAIVVKNTTPTGNMILWQDKNGDLLKAEAVMGIKMIRESKEEAMSNRNIHAKTDIATLTSAKSSVKINNPRKVKKLEAVIEGLDGEFELLNDDNQRVEFIDDSKTSAKYIIESYTKETDIGSNSFEEISKEYLSNTAYINWQTDEVKELSKTITKDKKTNYEKCSAIREWLFKNIETKTDIGITRSALDVLRSKVGVCRDHAILFAAFARAAGVPTKVVSGLIYTNSGFYYHAWAECFDGRWIPFDSTLNSDFVDATHIKLAEGDATSMFSLSRVIGNLKVNVLHYE